MKAAEIRLKINSNYVIFSHVGILILALILMIGINFLAPYAPNIPVFKIGLGLMAILILKYIYHYIYLKTITYTITKSQILFERGVFNKNKDTIELYRVKDYSESRTFIMRLIGAMKLTLTTSDKSHPELDLIGIDKSNIMDQIRILVEHQRKVKGVREFD